jgi:hypothetical protein
MKNLPDINLLPKPGFSNPNIGAINEDKDGMIWVGSFTGGLCRFNPETGKFLPEYIDLASGPRMEYFVFIKTGPVHCGWAIPQAYTTYSLLLPKLISHQDIILFFTRIIPLIPIA